MVNLKKCSGNHWLGLVIILVLVLQLSACGGGQKASPPQGDKKAGPESAKPQSPESGQTLINFGTAGSGGTFYYVGAGVSNVMSKYVEGVKVTPQGSAGGVENLRRMATKKLDIGLITPSDLVKVLGDKTVKADQIMIMGAGHESVSQLVARPDSPHKTSREAFQKGVKFGIGEPGSALQGSSDDYLWAHGLKRDDVKVFQISQAEMADGLKDKIIEVAAMGSGIPLPGVTDLAQALGGVTILELPDDVMKKLIEKKPYMFPFTIPPGTYKNLDRPVRTVGYYSLVICRADLPEDMVYKLVKAMYEHSDEIAKVHPAGASYKAQNAMAGADYSVLKMGVKYHPGSIKYLKEKSVWDVKYQ